MNERTFDQLLADFKSFWGQHGEQIQSFCKLQSCMLSRHGCTSDLDEIMPKKT